MNKSLRVTVVILLLAILSMTLAVSTALAHSRAELGPYLVVLGWESEPVIVGERNALILDITQDGQPVEGVEATLDVEVIFGPEIFRGNLAPTAEAGVYSVEMLPTVRGQYTARLVGSIGDLEVDELLEPEEVLPAGVLAFPEVPPDTRELQTTISALEGQLQTARLLAIVGVALGGLGLLAAAFCLIRRNAG